MCLKRVISRVQAILSDFGRAKISEPPKDLDADFMNKPVTTLKYRCPEMLKNANYRYVF